MRCTRVVASVVMVSLVGATTLAIAQPGNAPVAPVAPVAPSQPPPPAGALPGERSPGIALALSLGATAGCVAMGPLADATGDDEYAALGGACLWIAPSAGHWYAGKIWSTGMTIRTAAVAGLVLGLALVATDCAYESGCGETAAVGIGVGSMLAFFGGVVWDVATAPGQARTYNRKLRERYLPAWTVAPAISRDHAGLVLGGRF